MKGFEHRGDVLKVPLSIKDFCGDYCPYNRKSSCNYGRNRTTNETCKINILERTITLL